MIFSIFELLKIPMPAGKAAPKVLEEGGINGCLKL